MVLVWVYIYTYIYIYIHIYIYTRTTRALRARLGSSKRQPSTRSRLHAFAIANASGSWVLQTAPCNRESQFLSTKIGTHSASVPPTASQTRCASRPAAYVGTLITRSVPHKEFHLRPQRQGSQSAPPPIAAHPSRGSCSRGSTTHRSRDKVRTSCPRPFRHAPHADRALEGAPPMAPMGNSAGRSPAHFGTCLTRVVPHRELHLRRQWACSRGCILIIGHPLHTDRAQQGVQRACARLFRSSPHIRTAMRRALHEERAAPCATRDCRGLRPSPA